MNQITWDDFLNVELRAGTIVEAREFPEARKPAYILLIDFGPELGIKKSSAQITAHYSCDDLVGHQVIAVTNFPPKQIGPIISECLVSGFYDDDGEVILAVPEKAVANGSRLA
jgi:tRNA-binding protein